MFAAVGSFISSVSPVLSTLGTIFSVVSSFSSANKVQDSYNFAALDLSRTADNALLEARFQDVQGLQEEILARDKMRRLMSAQRASYRARGIDLTGSPTAVINDSLTQNRQDIENIQFNANSLATASRLSAGATYERARNTRKQGLYEASAQRWNALTGVMRSLPILDPRDG